MQIYMLKFVSQLFITYVVKLYHYFVVIENDIHVLVIDRTPWPLTLILPLHYYIHIQNK